MAYSIYLGLEGASISQLWALCTCYVGTWTLRVSNFAVDSQKFPSLLGLWLEDGHVPTVWLLLSGSGLSRVGVR